MKLMGNRDKKKLLWFVRMIVSGTLIGYLFFLIDIDQVRPVLSHARLGLLLCAQLLILVSFTFAACRWNLLLGTLDICQPLSQLYLYYITGSFYSMILPGSVSGDVVRAAICSRATSASSGYVAASILLERFCGLFTLLGIASCVVLFAPTAPPWEELHYLKPLPMLCLGCSILLTYGFVASRSYLEKVEVESIRRSWPRAIVRFASILTRISPRNIAGLLFYTGLFQITTIIADYCIAMSLNLSIPFFFYLCTASLTFIISAIPISLGGLGVREGMFVLFLSAAGVTLSDAAVFSLIVYCNRIVAMSFGPIAQLLIKFK